MQGKYLYEYFQLVVLSQGGMIERVASNQRSKSATCCERSKLEAV
jgi:hypothetical protein